MKIAIDVRHLVSNNPSGVGNYTIELIKKLKGLEGKHEFFLFASGSKRNYEKIEELRELGFPLHYAKIPNKILSLGLLSKKISLDEILAFNVDAWFFPNLNFINTNKPYFATLHDLSYIKFPSFYSYKMRIWHRLINPRNFYKKAHHVIAVSESSAIDAKSSFEISNITPIPLSASPDFEERKKPQDAQILNKLGLNRNYFLSISTVETRKNHHALIDAYEIYRNSEASNEQLVIAGQKGRGSRSLFRKISKSKFKDDILYLSYIDSCHRPAIMRQATALLFPSFMEGFGLPVAEALASGTPVITSSTTALLDFHEKGIIHINPFNVEELANSLKIVKTEKILVNAPKRNFEDVAKETLKVFEK